MITSKWKSPILWQKKSGNRQCFPFENSRRVENQSCRDAQVSDAWLTARSIPGCSVGTELARPLAYIVIIQAYITRITSAKVFVTYESVAGNWRFCDLLTIENDVISLKTN